MSMPIVIENCLVTNGKEKRVDNDHNNFVVITNGYRLYPLHDLIEVLRYEEEEEIGYAKINEVTWKQEQTICYYQLISLKNVN
ncbi:DUF2584 family protein [Saliterribacillus persicus]|uniref:Uncharacterized protein DUF2584 n=1 Tax=Saliterribacillus persicus TaxID=930114 RepID=A0A368XAI0_9BACI|nr:DUF2584 family protein [Saliterribacillus persicus]RCW64971.1 uncharacterized protein DUF2584 [Saliterribacillus persicus]